MNTRCFNCAHYDVCKYRNMLYGSAQRLLTIRDQFKINNTSNTASFHFRCKFYMSKKTDNFSKINNYSNR